MLIHFDPIRVIYVFQLIEKTWDISRKFKARENSMYAAITKAIQLTSTINNEKQIH